jgi:predicted O-methyltransferase YrrM
LLSLELDPKHIAVARRHIDLAKLQNKIEVKEGPAGDRYILKNRKYIIKIF